MHGIFGSEGPEALEMRLSVCGLFIAAEKTEGKRQHLQTKVETGCRQIGIFQRQALSETSFLCRSGNGVAEEKVVQEPGKLGAEAFPASLCRRACASLRIQS